MATTSPVSETPALGDARRDAATRSITLVVTLGTGSLDYYSQKLGERLPVRKIYTDVYERTGESFNVPVLSAAAARALLENVRHVRLLRGVEGPLHLPNHHLARYGHALAAPYVVTVHDVIRYLDLDRKGPFIHRPNARDRVYLRLDYAGVRKAAAVIAISEATKRDVVRHLGLAEDIVHVVYQGVHHAVFRPVEERAFEDRYVLYVGSEQPRKNLATLLEAFKRVKGDRRFADLKLVKVGGPGGSEGRFRELTLAVVRKHGLEDDVVFTGRIAERDLPPFYSGAECFVLPSLYEGFGLPALEAMACGCPSIVSNTTSLPEVTGDAALAVDPTDATALADAMAELLTNERKRNELRECGLERAREFSWERTARETLRVYERVV